MREFHCVCGTRVYFDNTLCLACGRELGFDPVRAGMVALGDAPATGDWIAEPGGEHFRFCANRATHCNWLIPADETAEYCLACRLTRTLPDLSSGDNQLLWGRLEAAKRRLLSNLLSLGLPVHETRLRFEFLEDRRSNPLVREMHVYTGHRDGVITVNVAEADDATREAIRSEMGEAYRTLLGHMRHESGHYYWSVLVDSEAAMAESRQLFGDDRDDYQGALQRYYESGPPAGWQFRYISAYASSHPQEDWAECWAHFLHIGDTLETAACAGLVPAGTSVRDDGWLDYWIESAVWINEMNRSLGLGDAYPFSLTPAVREKLEFIRRRVVCSSARS